MFVKIFCKIYLTIFIFGIFLYLPFLIKVSSAPIFTSVSPSNGPVAGGNTISINGTGFVSGGEYVRTVTISNTTGNILTNQRVMIRLNTQALISSAKMRTDCADLRAVSPETNVNLSLWVESGCNTADTIIWVFIPLIDVGGQNIYLTYEGSTSVRPSASSLNAVFPALSTNVRLWLASNRGLTLAAVSGTVSATAGGTTLTGTTTSFTSQIRVGSTITLNTSGQTRTVTAIASNTSLTVTPAWTTTVTGSAYTTNNANISQWNDQSGNVYHLTQGTAAARPKQIPSTLNSFPVVKFDSADFLNRASMLGSNLFNANNATIFLVQTPTATTGARTTWAWGSATTNIVSSAVDASNFAISDFPNATTGRLTSSTNILTTPRLLVQQKSSTNQTMFLNGSQIATHANSLNLTLTTSTNITIGKNSISTSRGVWEGDVAEFIIVRADLSVADRNQIENYLNTKYLLYCNLSCQSSSVNFIPLSTVGAESTRGSIVLVGTKICNNIVVVSTVQITCQVPASTTSGLVSLTIQNPDLTSANQTNAYFYINQLSLSFQIRNSDDTANINICNLGFANQDISSSCSYRLKVTTNSDSGFYIFMQSSAGGLKNSSGSITNASPGSGGGGGDDISIATIGTEKYGVQILPGSLTSGQSIILENPFNAGLNSVRYDYSINPTLLLTGNGVNNPATTDDTAFSSLVTHNLNISGDTKAGAYDQQITYTVVPRF